MRIIADRSRCTRLRVELVSALTGQGRPGEPSGEKSGSARRTYLVARRFSDVNHLAARGATRVEVFAGLNRDNRNGLDIVLAAVAEFCGGRPIEDDMTLLAAAFGAQ